MRKNNFSAIVALDIHNSIGKDKHIPWHIPEDLKHFMSTTLHHTVVMGRITAESIYQKLGSLLPKRRNIVMTRQKDYQLEEGIICNNMEDILLLREQVFIIGGEEVYKLFLPFCSKLYVTRIEKSFSGNDKFFPSFEQEFKIQDKTQMYSSTEKCRVFFETWRAIGYGMQYEDNSFSA